MNLSKGHIVKRTTSCYIQLLGSVSVTDAKFPEVPKYFSHQPHQHFYLKGREAAQLSQAYKLTNVKHWSAVRREGWGG